MKTIKTYDQFVNEAKRSISTDKLIKKLKSDKRFNFSFIKRSSEFYGGDSNGIWLSGEDYDNTMNGKRIFDYYAQSGDYDFGVLNDFDNFLSKHGWYAEWQDPGTIMLWPI